MPECSHFALKFSDTKSQVIQDDIHFMGIRALTSPEFGVIKGHILNAWGLIARELKEAYCII